MSIKNANDFRSKQTESMVRKALVKIMESKPIEKITVTELCKTASRGRFKTSIQYVGNRYNCFQLL